MFAANAIPHFIQGVLGYSYRTPFADPPGVGLSSPTVNVLWALFNIVAAYFLYRAGKVSKNKWWTILIFFIGFAIISIIFSIGK
ncbi:MAG: hypothetical protein LBT84_03810 [Spirochaetia bacterium]|jgi:hypothetical protein|nr:hypothetical protein [Spirochaetia bacterium]